MFSKKVSIIYVVVFAVISSALTISVFLFVNHLNGESYPSEGHESADTHAFNIRRVSGDYKYIGPIVSAEPAIESDRFSPIKKELTEIIANEKQNGLISASVYLREFSEGDWMTINPNERYEPGSLLKVGVLMTYLRMTEDNSKLLDSVVVYHGEKGFVFPSEHFKSDTVVEGHKYKINDLLQHMIKYSDNRATVYLENYMDTIIFKKEFKDLGITEPRFQDPHYTLNVKEYSCMFKALYNAGYLRKRASEDALALLTESTFRDGLLKELPASIVVAHKFGEAGDANIHELHESGIVYIKNNPYLITIMTKGTDWNKLSAVIGHISRIVYDKMLLTNNN
jgi:beta-lactamase class A